MLRRVLREWLYADNAVAKCIESPKTPDLDYSNATNLTIYPAIGGQVVEFRRYDRKTDNTYSARYVITKDEDFGDRLSKIITLENLKN
jgi:hypothetical protein